VSNYDPTQAYSFDQQPQAPAPASPNAAVTSGPWPKVIAALAVVALVAAGVMTVVALQARHNLDLTKATLEQSRSALVQTSGQLTDATTKLTATQRTLVTTRAQLAKAKVDLGKADASSKLSSARIEDLTTCIDGLYEINADYANGKPDDAQNLSDEIRGACTRAAMTADAGQ
jgi:hypothetical protein